MQAIRSLVFMVGASRLAGVRGFALGVITESLLTQEQTPELGFMAALTVEPIYVCLGKHRILPRSQSDGWGGLWVD